jgi:hypothetical protein
MEEETLAWLGCNVASSDNRKLLRNVEHFITATEALLKSLMCLFLSLGQFASMKTISEII